MHRRSHGRGSKEIEIVYLGFGGRIWLWWRISAQNRRWHHGRDARNHEPALGSHARRSARWTSSRQAPGDWHACREHGWPFAGVLGRHQGDLSAPGNSSGESKLQPGVSFRPVSSWARKDPTVRWSSRSELNCRRGRHAYGHEHYGGWFGLHLSSTAQLK